MSETKKTGKFQRFIRLAGEGLKHILFHNGWLKLIAVLISVALWAGLISQDETLTRDKTFNNVSVSVTGTETAKKNGYIVTSDLDSALKGVTCVAAVPQTQYDKAEASAYNVRIDLSRINSTGPQELKITSTSSATYGKITSTTPSSVLVDVEDYIVRQRIPVSVTVTGDTPAGWYLSQPSVDPALVAVSGPSNLVQMISRAKVVLDKSELEWKEGTMITSSEITLYNRSGEVISSPLLDITTEGLSIDSVLIEATMLPTKTFNLAEYVELIGNEAEGYQVAEIKVSPENVTVAARSEVLEQLNELAIEGLTINVDNMKESTVFQLKVQKPSDDAVRINDTVTVTVEIEPIDGNT